MSRHMCVMVLAISVLSTRLSGIRLYAIMPTSTSYSGKPLQEVRVVTDPLPPSHNDSLAVGKKVLAAGKPGVIESIAYSVATQAFLYVVAHDPRVRLTDRAHELQPAP